MKSIHKGFYQTTFGICLLEHDILYQVGKLPCFFLDHLLILSFDHDSYQRFGSGRTDQDTALSGEFFFQLFLFFVIGHFGIYQCLGQYFHHLSQF